MSDVGGCCVRAWGWHVRGTELWKRRSCSPGTLGGQGSSNTHRQAGSYLLLRVLGQGTANAKVLWPAWLRHLRQVSCYRFTAGVGKGVGDDGS